MFFLLFLPSHYNIGIILWSFSVCIFLFKTFSLSQKCFLLLSVFSIPSITNKYKNLCIDKLGGRASCHLKWTQQSGFKSRTSLFEFHIVLILLKKVRIELFNFLNYLIFFSFEFINFFHISNCLPDVQFLQTFKILSYVWGVSGKMQFVGEWGGGK